MLVSDLISMSLRKIGALSSGETIETTRQAEALSALQVMLRSWGAVGQKVFASTKETKTLTAGTAEYTWGSGGDITTARPDKVASVWIVDSSNISHPVDIISEQMYNGIVDKTVLSRPTSLFYHPAYPLGTVYLFPVPDAAETLHLDSFKVFTESGSYGLVTDTLAFPLYYQEPIVYNLAIRLAPEYGKSVSAEVAAIAESSLKVLTNLNASAQVSPIYIEIPARAGYGSGYDINSDSYC